ncbi:MAG: ATP-binding protein [Bacillota bacterium]|nr:ATP-binding protein [Bacillota bacterium]
MIYFYNITRKQERLLHRLHVQEMHVLLRKNPPLIQTIDYTCVAVIILDNKGIIIESNPQSSQLLSLPESSLIGQPISTVLDILHNFQPMNSSESGEFTFSNHKKLQKHLRYVTRPLLNDHIPAGTLVMLFDISEEKNRSEAYLQDAKLSVIGQVTAGLAHEIRNPLTTIKGFMQLITPEQWPESFRPYQQLILEEIETIDQLLNKFVLVTSPSAPKMQPVNLTETIQALAQTIQPIRLMQGVSLALELPSLPVYVMGDPEQLSQALLSLVNNAIEASPTEGKITIHLTEYESFVRIGVEDNGPGIPENLRHRILEPFFTTQEEGTGLGLTITQRIVLAHHGKLHFSERHHPCGTEAMIDLPCISYFTNNLSA